MGTRSTTRFYNEGSNEPVLCVYQQYDGYIEGVGHTLAHWLKDKKVLNGFGDHKMEDGYANGMGCLAAQYVKDQKDSIGGFYLTTRNDLQEYNYEVRYIDGKFEITVDNFKGTPEELLAYKEPDYEDEEL